ncbi:hypothetical protein J7I85_20210 [Arthrobacter sp. ISL-65]|nr:hypothetical protein [Arthrobacter sp. ISL-65]
MTSTDKDGNVVEAVEAFTTDDRQIVEEEANAYLAETGAEQRPPGFRWIGQEEEHRSLAEIVRRVRVQGGNAFRTRRSEAQVRGYLCFSDKT